MIEKDAKRKQVLLKIAQRNAAYVAEENSILSQIESLLTQSKFVNFPGSSSD